jgi:hypothetical protein
MLKGNEYIKELEAGQRFQFKDAKNINTYKFLSYEEIDGYKKIKVFYKKGNDLIIHQMSRSTIVKLIKTK